MFKIGEIKMSELAGTAFPELAEEKDCCTACPIRKRRKATA